MRILILGGDGYLGWPTAMHLSGRGHEIMAVDNYLRRSLCREEDVHPLFEVPTLQERSRLWKERSGYEVRVRIGDLRDWSFVAEIFQEFQPEAIVHYAEQPSAPYSMLSRRAAELTLHNNLGVTFNLIHAVQEYVPGAHIVKLGTMGEYGTPNIDIEEGWLEIEHKTRKDTFLFPRQAGSLYHTTKILDTDLLWFYVRVYGLRVTDLMQGPVYGIYTEENLDSEALAPFFNYDELFGTVLNRFMVQAASGYPLTVYGAGGQQRGLRAELMQLAGLELQGHDPAAAPVLHQQIQDVELVVKLDPLPDGLLVEGLEDHVTGAVGGVAGPPDGLLPEVLRVPAEAPLGDLAVLGAAEGEPHVLQLVHHVRRLAAHDLDGLLVAQVVAPLHGVEHVPLGPVAVVVHVAQGGADPPLRRAGVRAGRVQLADDGRADAGVPAQVQGGHEAGSPGPHDQRVVGVDVSHTVSLGSSWPVTLVPGGRLRRDLEGQDDEGAHAQEHEPDRVDDPLHHQQAPGLLDVVLQDRPEPVDAVGEGEDEQGEVVDPPQGVGPAVGHRLEVDVVDADGEVHPEEVEDGQPQQHHAGEAHEEPGVRLEPLRGRAMVSAAAPRPHPTNRGRSMR